MKQAMLEVINGELAKCIKCGSCRTICPAFSVLDTETCVARGKLRLIEAHLEGRLDLTTGLAERMSLCLMCKACAKNCPSGVRTDYVFRLIRNYLIEERGLGPVKNAAFTWLKYRRFFDLSLRLGSVFQGVIFKNAGVGNGRVPRIPLPIAGFNKRRIIPPLAKISLRKQFAVENKVEQPRMRVAFFTGCSMNYIYTDAGKAIIEVLQRNNIEVVIPPDQQCCGTPIFTYGDVKTAQSLVKQNLQAFQELEVDAIITGCGSCGAAWKKEFVEILDEGQEREQARKIAEKVYDISQFLMKYGYERPQEPLELTVTYHDPCHLNFGLGVKGQPREIIKSIPGITFKELGEGDKCCGSGGSFNLAYYNVSRQINDNKLASIAETDAQIILTGCPACMMHLEDGLGQSEKTTDVLHTIQLLARAYEKQDGIGG